MKNVTVEYISYRLQRSCVPSPVTLGKLIREFGHEPEVMKIATRMLISGDLKDYHMIPGNGHLEF